MNECKTSGPIRISTEIVDKYTGEISSRSQIVTRDKNFTKIWLLNYIDVVKEDYSKIDLIPFLLINKMDKHNKIKSTLANLSVDINYPKTKLSVALKNLKSKDFLRRIQNGLYMINPNVAYKGTSENRAIALREYFGLIETKELLQERERQKQIKETKAILKNLSPQDFQDLLSKNKFDNTVYDLIATTLVDNALVDNGGDIE